MEGLLVFSSTIIIFYDSNMTLIHFDGCLLGTGDNIQRGRGRRGRGERGRGRGRLATTPQLGLQAPQQADMNPADVSGEDEDIGPEEIAS